MNLTWNSALRFFTLVQSPGGCRVVASQFLAFRRSLKLWKLLLPSCPVKYSDLKPEGFLPAGSITQSHKVLTHERNSKNLTLTAWDSCSNVMKLNWNLIQSVLIFMACEIPSSVKRITFYDITII